jgi:3-oxoacyl-[acyl-carrier-protein] synthase II
MLLGIGPGGPVVGRRVAITGMGVIACCGTGLEAFWDGLCGPPPLGERRVESFDPTAWFGPKEVRRVDRFAQFSVAAAEMALTDAGDLDADPERSGVIFAAGVGGFESIQEQVVVAHEKGLRRVSPFLVPMMMANAGAANISMRAGWHGPCETVVTACAASNHSLANAARLIASGRCDVVIGGGAEAAMTTVGIAAFQNMTALSTTGHSRPFDARRDGFIMTEGAGALVLEDLDRARARGARIYGEVLGAASTADAHHITAPSPDGVGAASCMRLAIEDAGLQPADIRHINAHGTSTPHNDLAESKAIRKVFGTPGPAVTSTKGVTGHGLGAAGALEAVAITLSIHRKQIPPTAGYEVPDPEIDLDIVQGTPRDWEPGPALSNSFGFGGHNACLVFGPVGS